MMGFQVFSKFFVLLSFLSYRRLKIQTCFLLNFNSKITWFNYTFIIRAEFAESST